MTSLTLSNVSEWPLVGLSWTAEVGMHVVLSDSMDFASTFVEVITGLRHTRSGAVRVGGIDPSRSPETRRRIASVLAHERLLESRSVTESLRLEYSLRRINVEPSGVLGAWQLDSWSHRDPRRLGSAEHRAVALASALKAIARAPRGAAPDGLAPLFIAGPEFEEMESSRADWFTTHPPLRRRVAALLETGDQHGIEIGTRGIDGRGIAGGTGTKDQKTAVLDFTHV